MYPPPFEYEAPTSLAEALALLSAKPEAKVLAGGQSLLPLMKQRLVKAPMLIDITRVDDLVHIQDEGETVAVGAKLTHADAAASELLHKEVPLLARSSSWVADRQVRRRGTVCGSLATADPTADACCAVLGLGGTMLAQSIDGVRAIPADQFLIKGFQTALKPQEILTAVRIPKRKPGEGWGYDKLGVRGSHSGWAIIGVAAWIKTEAGTIRSARLAISGSCHVTSLARQAAQALIGTDGSDAALNEAARLAAEEIDCIADINGSVSYKKQLVQVYARRALLQAIANAGL